MLYALLSLVVLTLTSVVAAIRLRSRRRAAVTRFPDRCARCGYDVRENPRRCPECGDDLLRQVIGHYRPDLDDRS